jgi:hypothetical protein
MAVSYTVAGDTFDAGKPRPWTERRLANIGQWRNVDSAPDGRIVALLPVEQKDADHRVVFVENFLDQLRRPPRGNINFVSGLIFSTAPLSSSGHTRLHLRIRVRDL